MFKAFGNEWPCQSWGVSNLRPMFLSVQSQEIQLYKAVVFDSGWGGGGLWIVKIMALLFPKYICVYIKNIFHVVSVALWLPGTKA